MSPSPMTCIRTGSPARSWRCLLLPPELQADGPERTLAALADPGQRAMLLADEKFTEDYLQNLYLGCLPESFAQFAGQSVAAAAEDDGARVGGGVGAGPAVPDGAERRGASGPADAD